MGKRSVISALVLFFILIQNFFANGQVSVSNLAEYQVGNQPDTDPKNLTSLYNQTNLSFRSNDFTIGLRLENFQADVDRKYNKFTQRYMEYQRDWFRLRIGNYYGILGRGLVFRAFELPGVLIQDPLFGVRQSLSRDVDGFLTEMNWKYLQITLLRGKALESSSPLIFEDENRTIGIVEGGQIKMQPFNWLTIGGTYARYSLRNMRKYEVGSAIFALSLNRLIEKLNLNDLSVDFYTEYAQKQATQKNLLSLKDNDPHALYFSANFIYKNLGLSFEHKNYQDFNLRMNDPPPLVKEHSFYLLNRATHVLVPENEKGNQIELTFSLPNHAIFTLNYSKAENEISPALKYSFSETFFGVDLNLTDAILTKFFIDQNKDEFPSKAFKDRLVGGMNLEWQYNDFNSIGLDVQALKFSRTYDPKEHQELYGAITFAKSPQFSISLIGQRSTDPFETDIPQTDVIETEAKTWLSVAASYRFSNEHEVFLFYGKRRGGPACAAGTCYEVLPFEGFEMRLISRF